MFWVLAIFLLTYLSACLYLFFAQNSLIFQPNIDPAGNPIWQSIAHQEHYFNSKNANKLHAWFVEGDTNKKTVLICHGNAGHIKDRAGLIQIINQAGYSVFIFDYQGYGQSQGTPSEQNTYDDVESAWNYLTTQLNKDPNKIIVLAQSLGGAIGSYLCTKVQPAFLILCSTFTSIKRLGQEHYPIFPVNYLLKINYNTLENCQKSLCPVLVMHSKDDKRINIKHGLALYQAAPSPKKFIELHGEHGTAAIESKDIYIAAIEDMEREHLAR